MNSRPSRSVFDAAKQTCEAIFAIQFRPSHAPASNACGRTDGRTDGRTTKLPSSWLLAFNALFLLPLYGGRERRARLLPELFGPAFRAVALCESGTPEPAKVYKLLKKRNRHRPRLSRRQSLLSQPSWICKLPMAGSTTCRSG